MPQFLLIVTEDGYGKRVPVQDVPCKGRNTLGVKLSNAPVVAALVVDGVDGEVVIMSAAGKLERVAVGDVPVRRRRVFAGGKVANGLRLIRLQGDDRVASAALAAPSVPVGVADSPPKGNWPGSRVGLRDGEETVSTVVFTRVLDAEEIEPGGEPVVSRDEWAQTEVHNASKYWCLRCGRPYPDPSSAYKCIDSHIPEMLREAA